MTYTFSRSLVVQILLVGAVLVAAPHTGRAAPDCDPGGADAAAIAQARAAVEQACDCDSAISRRSWQRCVWSALRGAAGGDLSNACRRVVQRAAIHATCGYGDRTVCCRTTASGHTTATLRRTGRCSAPPGGSACASDVPWVADACTDGGCASRAACGNGIVEPGEFCDGEEFCGPDCSASFGGCCSLGELCIATSAVGANACRTVGGSFALGAVCAGEPCPNDVSSCHVAPCTNPAFPPTSVCCQLDAGGCTDETLSDLGSLASFVLLQCSSVGSSVIGSCGPGGRCVPRS